jgi:hypothetical protein
MEEIKTRDPYVQQLALAQQDLVQQQFGTYTLPDLLQGHDPRTNVWTVYNYQVPVPQGDCSVHLLCFENECRSAFIMDGGLDKAAGDCLIRTINMIVADHNLDQGWLTGYVCTHWDADHYRGFVMALPTASCPCV